MFAYKTNLFSYQGNIKDPFYNVNHDSRFKDKKQSLNQGKTFFYKIGQKDNIPLKVIN